MAKIITILSFILCGCNYNSDEINVKREYPSSSELKYKIGDCLYFNTSDSTYGCVIVCDFSKDIGGIWYGIFYTGYDSTAIPSIPLLKEGKVMGRKVESTLDKEGYKSCLDGDFIHDSLFTNENYFTLIGNIQLIKEINLGAHGAVSSMPNLRLSFRKNKELRLKPPDHYKDHWTKINNFHPEEYFSMTNFTK